MAKGVSIDVDELELAYMAGFFDGEGCVFIGHTNNRHFILQVLIANTNLEILEMIQTRFGGNIIIRPPKDNHREIFNLRLHGDRAANMLKSLQPYLMVKSEQVRIGIKFQNTMIGFFGNQYRTNLSDDIIKIRNDIRDELLLLNRRGVEV